MMDNKNACAVASVHERTKQLTFDLRKKSIQVLIETTFTFATRSNDPKANKVVYTRLNPSMTKCHAAFDVIDRAFPLRKVD